MDYTEKDLDGFVSRLRAISRQIGEVTKLVHGDTGQCSTEYQMWEYKLSCWGGPELHNIFVYQQSCLHIIHDLLLRAQEGRENING